MVSSVVDDISIVDIDVINGEPVYLDEVAQTGDQRAALAVYIAKGTIPSELDFGVNWATVYDAQNTTLQLNNELQQQVQNTVGSAESNNNLPNTQYTAQLLMEDGGYGVVVMRG